jgi:hypothetical protein
MPIAEGWKAAALFGWFLVSEVYVHSLFLLHCFSFLVPRVSISFVSFVGETVGAGRVGECKRSVFIVV